MTKYFNLTQKQQRYLTKVAKSMRLDWKSLAARPTDPLTTFIRECCDCGTPSTEVPDLWLECFGNCRADLNHEAITINGYDGSSNHKHSLG